VTRRAAIRRHQQLKLNLIFAAVPLILCQGKCQSSCGPIDASPIEKKLFKIATSKPFPNPKKTPVSLLSPSYSPSYPFSPF
jgi:hypothetical protein